MGTFRTNYSNLSVNIENIYCKVQNAKKKTAYLKLNWLTQE
jgi:hypothetical protein